MSSQEVFQACLVIVHERSDEGKWTKIESFASLNQTSNDVFFFWEAAREKSHIGRQQC